MSRSQPNSLESIPEPGCLKKHLEELFTMYSCLKLLTGDTMYTQRPLLEANQKKT